MNVELGAKEKVLITHLGSTRKLTVYVSELGELEVTAK